MKKFELGQVVATKGMSERMEKDIKFNAFIGKSFQRYMKFDWGDMEDEDKELNNKAVESGEERILAVYIYPDTKEEVYIITEWDRSVTTILFPHEY